MTIIADRYIQAKNLSEGWLDAVRHVRGIDGHKVVHLLVRICDPEAEVPAIRTGAQALIDTWNVRKKHAQQLWDVESVRNTIFPAVWARKNPKPKDLAAYYIDRYDKSEDGLLTFSENGKGTYFGRIVAYPRGDGSTGDQLSDTVRKLLKEKKTPGPKSSRYEINIYNERLDTNPMSFPLPGASIGPSPSRQAQDAGRLSQRVPRWACVRQLPGPRRTPGLHGSRGRSRGRGVAHDHWPRRGGERPPDGGRRAPRRLSGVARRLIVANSGEPSGPVAVWSTAVSYTHARLVRCSQSSAPRSTLPTGASQPSASRFSCSVAGASRALGPMTRSCAAISFATPSALPTGSRST